MAVRRQHQRDDFLGDGVGVGAGRVHHVDALAPRVLGVDVVVAGTGAHHHLEARQGVDDRGGDLFTADDQAGRVGVGADQFSERFFGILHNIEAVVPEDLGSCRVKFGRNEDGGHGYLAIQSRAVAWKRSQRLFGPWVTGTTRALA